jgi:hypothetical protein
MCGQRIRFWGTLAEVLTAFKFLGPFSGKGNHGYPKSPLGSLKKFPIAVLEREEKNNKFSFKLGNF